MEVFSIIFTVYGAVNVAAKAVDLVRGVDRDRYLNIRWSLELERSAIRHWLKAVQLDKGMAIRLDEEELHDLRLLLEEMGRLFLAVSDKLAKIHPAFDKSRIHTTKGILRRTAIMLDLDQGGYSRMKEEVDLVHKIVDAVYKLVPPPQSNAQTLSDSLSPPQSMTTVTVTKSRTVESGPVDREPAEVPSNLYTLYVELKLTGPSCRKSLVEMRRDLTPPQLHPTSYRWSRPTMKSGRALVNFPVDYHSRLSLCVV
jgi:hypothetical protein